MLGLSIARGRAPLALLLASLATVGCDDETGILIEVTAEDPFERLDILELHIGVAEDIEVIIASAEQCRPDGQDQTWYLETSVEAPREAELNGQDISEDPYRWLLRPRDIQADAELMVVAVGKDESGEPIAIGQLGEPVSFKSDKVLRWDLPMRPISTTEIAVTNGCACGPAGGILNSDDIDCDGSPNQDDCEDKDGTIGTGLDEVCDGADTDCDSTTSFEGELDCLVFNFDNRCVLGTRTCQEEFGLDDEPFGFCIPRSLDEPLPFPPRLCDLAEQDCRLEPNQLECVGANIQLESCEVLIDSAGEICPLSTVRLSAPGNPEPDECEWRLLDGFFQEHYAIFLANDTPDSGQQEAIDQCDALLRIEALIGERPKNDRFLLSFQDDDGPDKKLYVIKVKPIEVSECPSASSEGLGLKCDNLENAGFDPDGFFELQ